MSEIIQVEVQTEPAPTLSKQLSTRLEERGLKEKTLEEQREDLRIRLQINRRVLEHKLLNVNDQHFPRSATMRFLSNQSTRHIVQRVAGAALGIQAFKSIRYGYSLMQFARTAYSAFKATRNVVKAKEGKPIS